jgi:hypothetical protein
MSYDSAAYNVRREYFAGEAGGGATTEYAKFRVFQASRLKKVHAFITTAGTATTHGFNVFHGTTSIGTIALSTATANANALGGANSSALLDRALAAGDQVSVKSLADAAGKAHLIYEYEVTPDAVQS